MFSPFPSDLVILIVYVFFVPSSAVTTTENVFLPVSNFLLPVPLIFALEFCAVAYISIVSVSDGTVTSYEVVPSLNPEKSFGLIPKLLKFALLDFLLELFVLELLVVLFELDVLLLFELLEFVVLLFVLFSA